jgi:hypothetical protein
MERQQNELGAIEVHFTFGSGVSPSGSTAPELPMGMKLRVRECIDGSRTRLESVGFMNAPDHKYDVTEVWESDGPMKRYDPSVRRGSISTGYLPLEYRGCCSLFTDIGQSYAGRMISSRGRTLYASRGTMPHTTARQPVGSTRRSIINHCKSRSTSRRSLGNTPMCALVCFPVWLLWTSGNQSGLRFRLAFGRRTRPFGPMVAVC